MQKLIRYASILLLILFVTITQMFRTTLMSMQMQIDVLESKQSSQKSFPKKKNGEYLPEVTLLLSYPNSGTTYTLGAVRSISNTDTATNYGTESKSKERLYPKKEIKNGPYLKSLRPLPKDRILTKTHCSGYSNTQPINNYIVNPKDFERSCNSKNGKVKYDRRVLPKSAIRLIRDPFDNTVSNYHHWLHNLMTPRQKKAMDEIPTDEERFKKFCNIFDTLFEEKMKKERVSSSFKDRYTKDLLEGVPCHQFFFRYTQWHNNANKMKDLEDVLVIKYDHYETKFNETIAQVLEFLHLPEVNKPSDVAPFKTGKSYRHYYSEEEKVAISKFLRHEADQETMDYISSYLTDE